MQDAFAQFVNIQQGKDNVKNRLIFDDSFSGRAVSVPEQRCDV